MYTSGNLVQNHLSSSNLSSFDQARLVSLNGSSKRNDRTDALHNTRFSLYVYLSLVNRTNAMSRNNEIERNFL